MFKSEPICILKAGTTVDGRVIEQNILDEIADSYDPNVYSARINENHYKSRARLGSVFSVEKRGDKLFAVLKPNSRLLSMAEQGQMLHTSCEYRENFSDTGKAYLTGLALTDDPASLGTTEIHLSSQNKDRLYATFGLTITPEQLSDEPQETDDTLFQKFKSWLSGEEHSEQLSQQQEDDQMSKETEELLKQSIEQNKELTNQLGQLVTHLSAQNQPEQEPNDVEESQDLTELKGQVTELSSQVETLSGQLEKLSKLTDEQQRELAGADGEEEPYL